MPRAETADIGIGSISPSIFYLFSHPLHTLISSMKKTTRLLVLFLTLVAGTRYAAGQAAWNSPSGTWFTPNGWWSFSESTGSTGTAVNAPNLVTAEISSGNVIIGAGVSATVTYVNLGVPFTTTSLQQSATLTVDGYLRANSAVSIGLYLNNATQNTGDGYLIVGTTGTVSSGGNFQIAHRPLSTGSASIAGAFFSTGAAYIGNAGTSSGVLIIEALGTGSFGGITYVANGAGSTGLLSIAGTFLSSTNASIGNGGASSGALIVEALGTASFGGNTFVANGAGSTGLLDIAGTYLSNGYAYIGSGGTSSGTLTVKAFGTGSFVGVTRVGSAIGSTGLLDIAGTGTYFTTQLLAGYSGSGTVNLAAGGYLRTTGGDYIADQEGSAGIFTINGFWERITTGNGSVVAVGNRGLGILNVGATGTIIGGFYNLGVSTASGTGIMNISGYVETSGAGRLRLGLVTDSLGIININPGGTLKSMIQTTPADSDILGYGVSGTGIVNVNGGYWLSSGGLRVGASGVGIVTISNGGTLVTTGTGAMPTSVPKNNTTGASNGNAADGADPWSSFAFIGENVNGAGTVTITGPGSIWSHNGGLYVGYAGQGYFEIGVGGTFASTAAGVWAGFNTTSTGTIILGGVWTQAAGDITLGGNSSASLSAGARGYLEILGTGTLNATGRNLVVGDAGIGEFVIRAGGVANIGALYLGDGDSGVNASGYGTGTIFGTLNASGQTYIGNYAPATFYVANGGTYTTTTHYNQAANVGAVATATIAGVHTQTAGDVTIGARDTAHYHVVAGGTATLSLTSGYGAVYLARYATNTGFSATMTIDGYYYQMGSHRLGVTENSNNTGYFIVGNSGTAFVGSFEPGYNIGTTGYITIGDNAFTQVSRDTNIGFSGNGHLYVAQTGTLRSNGVAHVGRGYAGGFAAVATATIAGFWSVGGSDFSVANSNQATAHLHILPTGTVTGPMLRIGIGATTSGTVTLEGSLTTTATATGTSLVVADSGTAVLDIRSGVLLETYANDFIGHGTTGNGTVFIQNGAIWRKNNSNNLWVGGSLGTGAIIIENGGLLDTNLANGGTSTLKTYIGYGASASGTVVIKPGGLWQAGNITLGHQGRGEIIVQGTLSMQPSVSTVTGGTVGNATIYIADNTATSVGILRIKDGGVVDIYNYYIPVNRGTGYIYVESGGTLKTGNSGIELGQYAGSRGELHVDGFWEGRGTFRPSDGNGLAATDAPVVGIVTVGVTGTILTGATYVSDGPVSTGTMSINGYWDAAGEVRIASATTSKATVTIGQTGVLVSTGNAQVGYGVGSTGTLTIDGKWRNGTYFSIGSYGTGYLVVGTTGSLATGIAEIGRYYNANGAGAGLGIGTITHNGIWTNSDRFYLGYEGVGSATLGANAILTVGSTLFIGYGMNASGTLTTAPGSVVTVASNVELGFGADNANGLASVGHATIGGYLSTGGQTRVGHRGSAISSLTITGTYINAGNFFVGGVYGTGTMFLGSNGRLEVGGHVYVGDRLSTGDGIPNAVGYATIAGYWSTTGNLNIAANSYGTLNLLSTGTIITGGNSNLANAPGAVASATVAGYWRTNGAFYNGNPSYATAQSSLTVASTGTIITAGNYYSNGISTLAVTLDPSRTMPHINAAFNATIAGTIEIDGFETVSYSGVTKASQLAGTAQTILRAPAGVTGDFSRIVIRANGTILEDISDLADLGLPDYIAPAAYRAAVEGAIVETEYRAGFGLSWQSSSELAHGNFTIPDGETFEIDIPLTNRLGAYASGWDGKKLTKLGNGTLILSANDTRTGDTSIYAGTLKLAAAPDIHLGALRNDGLLDFNNDQLNQDPAASGRLFRTVTATSLAGTGSYRMTVDLANGASDKLIILGDATGSHRLLLTGIGASPTGDEATITLATIGGMGTADWTATGTMGSQPIAIDGSFDYGSFNYKVGLEGNKVIVAPTGLAPAVHDAIRGVPGAQSILWNLQRDTLAHHLGELRSPRDSVPPDKADLWVRAHTARARLDDSPTAIAATDMRPFDLDLTGAEAGADFAYPLENAHAVLGLYLAYARADQDFHTADHAADATAKSDSIGGGLYAAWLHDNGLFANLTLSAAHYQNSFSAADGSGNTTTADYRDRAFGASIELGWRANLGSGFFAEPSFTASRTLLSRGSYSLKNPGGGSGTDGLSVRGNAATITRYRALCRAGHAWTFDSTGWFEFAVRAGAAREESSGGEVSISRTRWRPNLDGNSVEAGITLAWQPAAAFQLHLDYDLVTSKYYNIPWAVSFGIRCQF